MTAQKTCCPYTARLPESVMSNFAHEIDRAVEAELKMAHAYAAYPCWNCHCRVWWVPDLNIWRCEVWVWGTPDCVYDADTLERIMEQVRKDYGDD